MGFNLAFKGLNDVVGSSGYAESGCRATNEQDIINDSGGSGRGLIFGIIQGFFHETTEEGRGKL